MSSPNDPIILNEISDIQRLFPLSKIRRPLIGFRVAAGFPSPAEDYIEKIIDLNRELIHHPLATFFVRVTGDSMEPDICEGEFLVVDRAIEARTGDIVIARIGDEMCVKEIRFGDDSITLVSANKKYAPIKISEEMDFEIWGKVLWSIKGH